MFLFGDFNINLLNYNIHPPTNEFLDSPSYHYFLPLILQPSRVTSNSKTLRDNIFSNMTVPNIISIWDHLLQFLAAVNIIFSASYPKYSNHEREWSRFDQENFVLNFFSINWDNVLLSSNTNIEISYKTFLKKVWAPLKNSKIMLKFKDKPWITPGLIQTKMKKINSFQYSLNWKNFSKKEAHIRYKQYRNLLSTLLKKVNNFILPDFFKGPLKT